MSFTMEPMAWYIAGPLIALVLALLLIVGNKTMGISSSFRHICAATVPGKIPFLNYDWKSQKWNLFFVLGIIIGGSINGLVVDDDLIVISKKTSQALVEIGITSKQGLMPAEIFDIENISFRNLFLILFGGFLVGFGTRYAGGCTSGHAIMGLSNLQWPSLVASIFFFVGGTFATFILLPLIF